MLNKLFEDHPHITLALIFIFLFIGIILLIDIIQLLEAKKLQINATTLAKQKELEWMMSEHNPHNQRIEPLYARLEGTKRLLDLANDMISEEVAGILFSYKAINKEYPVQKMDNDIKQASDSVLKGIKTANLLDDGIMITSEYLAASITKITTQVLIEEVKKYNSTIRLSTMSTPPEM